MMDKLRILVADPLLVPRQDSRGEDIIVPTVEDHRDQLFDPLLRKLSGHWILRVDQLEHTIPNVLRETVGI